jgi:hypothetical protein
VTARAAYSLPRAAGRAAPHFSRLAIFQFEVSGGEIGMLVEKSRLGTNLLSEFTLMIVGAFVVGLPMAVAIIWVCS